MNIAFGITGSFCTHAQILIQIKDLVKKGYNKNNIYKET